MRIRRVVIGVLPNVNITELNRDAISAKSVYSSTLRLTVSPAKSRRNVPEKGSVALSKNSKQSGCVFQNTEPPKKSIQRKSGILVLHCNVTFSKGTQHPVKIRERNGPSQGVIQKCEPLERSPFATKFEDRTQEETMQHERCARRDAWEMAKTCPSAQR